MSKRTKLVLILLLGLLLLAIGLYFLLSPFLEARKAAPPAARGTTPYMAPGQGTTPAGQPGGVAPAVTTAEANGLRILENKARTVVERVGSGASRDGFLGYQDALTEMTENGRRALLEEQRKMQEDHPASGASYGMTTRAISARLSKGNFGEAFLEITVEAIQTEDAGLPGKPVATKAKRTICKFIKQADGTYLIDSLDWSDVEL